MFTHPIAIIQKFENVVVDYAYDGFLSLQLNIFAKTKKFVKPFLPVHTGPRSNLLSPKNYLKYRDAVPLKLLFNSSKILIEVEISFSSS